MAIPGAFPRITIRTFTLSISHLHIQYGNMAIKTTHYFRFFSNFSTKPHILYEGAIFLRKFNIKN